MQCIKPQLVAVSKTKPVELIIEAYEEGQRHFGENYAKELIEKANHPSILEKCKDIRWHFIGNLQSNKVNKLVNLPNLYMIETLDEEKLAITLNKSWSKFRDESERLKIMIQVNTSGENEKNGVEPSGVVDLTKFVLENCPNLEFDGIMTIGKFGYNLEDGPNPDFLKLKECRDEICQSLGLDWKNINLSMGMSDDFEHAVSETRELDFLILVFADFKYVLPFY